MKTKQRPIPDEVAPESPNLRTGRRCVLVDGANVCVRLSGAQIEYLDSRPTATRSQTIRRLIDAAREA